MLVPAAVAVAGGVGGVSSRKRTTYQRVGQVSQRQLPPTQRRERKCEREQTDELEGARKVAQVDVTVVTGALARRERWIGLAGRIDVWGRFIYPAAFLVVCWLCIG